MYREFLRLTGTRLELLCDKPSLEVIHSTTHTIAGTAGMLGACQVAARARDLSATADLSFPIATEIARVYEACSTLSQTLRACQVPL